jgi:hypothetical protein
VLGEARLSFVAAVVGAPTARKTTVYLAAGNILSDSPTAGTSNRARTRPIRSRVRLTRRAFDLRQCAPDETYSLKERAPETALNLASGRALLRVATASDLGWKESASTIRNALADSIKAVEAIADEFQAELGRLKASGAFTGVGLKMRAGEMGAGTLDRAMRFGANVAKGREAVAELDRKLAAAAVIGDADSPVVEMRQREIREYLHSLDPLQAQLLLEEGIRLRDGDLLGAVLGALRIIALKIVSQSKLEEIRKSWAADADPLLAAQRQDLAKLTRSLEQAVQSLRKTLSDATGGEVGLDDPIAVMARGEAPTAA